MSLIKSNLISKALHYLAVLSILLIADCTAMPSNIKQGKEQLTIVEQLEMALEAKSSQQLYSVEERMYAIWRGEKVPGWEQLRDSKLTALLSVLEIMEKHIDWQLDMSISIDKTLTPPLDYDVMRYSTGFGISQIKDPRFKEKVKKDLHRVRQALKIRQFQSLINYYYPKWLWIFTGSIHNDFNTNRSGANAAALDKLITKTIKSTTFKSCIKHIANVFYTQSPQKINDLIKQYQGNCDLIIKHSKE